MKKLLSVALITLACIVTANAQKKDRESMGWLKYIQCPTDPLPLDYKTYTLDVQAAHDDAYRRDEILEKFSFAGYEKAAEDQDGDISFYIEEYPLVSGESERKKKQTKVKKDGVETTKTEYYYVNTLKYKYTLKMSNKDGETIHETAYAGVKKVEGSKSTSGNTAWESYKKKMSETKAGMIQEAVAGLRTEINNKFGFPKHQLSAVGFAIKPKKYNYDEFNNALETLKKAVVTSNETNQDISKVEADLKSVIAVCEKEIATKEDSKKARFNPKATAAAYYNITMSYIILKDYDAALTALAKGRELDKGIGDANYIQTLVTKLAERSKIYNDFLKAN
ncbi:hypothetical protein DMA11_13620 [Marinilabiliaceae bacterium JC017]|nr:hypothetical protein DMA11_13620 [Marinilabiliaceae bacterium JC017]